MGAGRRLLLGFDEMKRETEMRGIREKNVSRSEERRVGKECVP